MPITREIFGLGSDWSTFSAVLDLLQKSTEESLYTLACEASSQGTLPLSWLSLRYLLHALVS